MLLVGVEAWGMDASLIENYISVRELSGGVVMIH